MPPQHTQRYGPMTEPQLRYDEMLVAAKLVVVMQYVEAEQSELFL